LLRNLKRRLPRTAALLVTVVLLPLLALAAAPQVAEQEPPSMYNWEYPNTPGARARMAADPTAYQFERALFSVTERARQVREAIERGEIGRAAAEQADVSAAVSGAYLFPVIVGAYAAPDSARTVDLTALNNRLWSPGYSDATHLNGSVYDYYQEVSYGRLFMSGDIYGYVQADSSVGYYVDQAGDEQIGFQDWLDQMIATVDTSVSGVNFADYDGDDDGFVDTLVLIHNLVGAESQNFYSGTTGFWSHRWTYRGVDFDTSIGGSGTGQYYITDDIDPNAGTNGNSTGKMRINDYVIQPLVNSDLTMINIGVFCHELGHAFGLPDFYDTDVGGSGGDSEGLGHWCLMSSGSWRNSYSPAHMGAISKLMLGWVDPLVLTDSDTLDLAVPRVGDNEFIVKIQTSQMNPQEYFLVENRQAYGFDQHLHGTGLVVYHVDDSVSSNNKNPNNLRWAVEQADGLFNLENNQNRGDGGDPWPGSFENTAFGYDTVPSSETHAPLDSYFQLELLSASLDTMRVNIFGTPAFLLTGPSEVGYLADLTPDLTWESYSGVAGWGTVQYEVQVATETSFASALMDTSATNSFEWTGSLAENTIYYWRVRAFDSLGNSRINSGGHRQFVIDVNGPDLSIGALRNPIVRNELDLYLVSSEPLLSSSLSADGTDLSLTGVTAIESFIEVADYVITGTGTIVLHADGQDAAGNSSTADASLQIASISALSAGEILSADGVLTLQVPPGTVRSQAYAVVLSSEGTEGLFGRAASSETSSLSLALSPVYWVDLPDRVSGRKMNLVMKWPPGVVTRGEMPTIWHEGSEGSSALVTAVDLSAGTATAIVDHLGSFQLRSEGDPLTAQIDRLTLEPAYPNPFNPETRIAFRLPASGPVRLIVLNTRGQQVRVLVDAVLPAGSHQSTWDGRNDQGRRVASGIYLYVLETPSGTLSRKMTLIR
jgi:M6 family metalloprotease-like protein